MVVHSEKCLILAPFYSVLSVCSVVFTDKRTTEHTENTEKTLNKKQKSLIVLRVLAPTGVNSN